MNGPFVCPTCGGRGGACGTCRGSGQTWTHLAVPVTAPVPAGPTDAQGELREEIVRVYRTWPGDASFTAELFADAILALPAVRDALAAQEAVKRVEALAERFDTLGRSLHSVPAADAYDDAAVELRRALAGES